MKKIPPYLAPAPLQGLITSIQESKKIKIDEVADRAKGIPGFLSLVRKTLSIVDPAEQKRMGIQEILKKLPEEAPTIVAAGPVHDADAITRKAADLSEKSLVNLQATITRQKENMAKLEKDLETIESRLSLLADEVIELEGSEEPTAIGTKQRKLGQAKMLVEDKKQTTQQLTMLQNLYISTSLQLKQLQTRAMADDAARALELTKASFQASSTAIDPDKIEESMEEVQEEMDKTKDVTDALNRLVGHEVQASAAEEENLEFENLMKKRIELNLRLPKPNTDDIDIESMKRSRSNTVEASENAVLITTTGSSTETSSSRETSNITATARSLGLFFKRPKQGE